MIQNRWHKVNLTFICLVFGVLLLGAQVLGQEDGNASVISAPLSTTEPEQPTLLQFQLDRADDRVSDASASLAHTEVITALADTMVTQGYPTANCADALQIRVGYDTYLNPAGETLYSLIRFNLAGISTEATVHSARLQLLLSGSYDYPGHNVPITPYRISSPWSVDTVTWGSQPSVTEAYTPTWVIHGAGIWYSFDITDLVRQWAAGNYPNYGLLLKGPTAIDGWRAFASSETIYPPHLIVEYEQQPSFDLALVPDAVVVQAGQHTSPPLILYLTAIDGFSSSTTLDIAGLPPDMSFEWSADTVIPTASTLLTLTTALDTPSGVYTFTITGTSASLVRSTQATLQVLQPDFEIGLDPPMRFISSGQTTHFTTYLTATDGFTNGVLLDVGGLPVNATHEWATNPVTPTASTVLTITTAPDTLHGTYPLTITGTSGSLIHTAHATLNVTHPDFELHLEPPSRSVMNGWSTQYTADVVAIAGFTGSVTLDVHGLPSNTQYLWESNPITPTASTALTIVTTMDTVTGTYPLTVTGTSGEISHSAYASLVINIERIYLPLLLRNHPTDANLVLHTSLLTSESPWLVPNPAEVAAVSRIALLIGVADYEHMDSVTATRQDDKTHDLGYPTHDAFDLEGEVSRSYITAKMSQVSSPGGDTEMTVLVDNRATKGAIHAAIVNWMDPLEDENTLVIISFSGHGMYAPDDDGDEDDPYDEFIVPHDIDLDQQGNWLPETAISDDELASWLDELESQQIVVFIDSCFAGGLVEDTSVNNIKGFSWQPADPFEASAEQWRDSFLEDIQGAGRVVLAATLEEQASWEFGALQNGVFTYYLVEALRSSAADTNDNGWISAEEAHYYLAGRVDSYVWNHTSPPTRQNPQMLDGVSGEVDITQPVWCDSCPTW